MTIITAVQKNGEVAIACDTQSTSYNRTLKHTADYKTNHSKLLHYGDSILGLAGYCSIHQIFEDLLSQTEPAPWSNRTEIFRWFLDHHDVLKNRYFLNPTISNGKGQIIENNWSSALIINPNGIFRTDGSRAVFEYSKFWAIGSGQDFALGALEILYEQDLTASEIAEAAAFTATQFNPGCAPPIYVETIPMRRTSKTKSKKKKRTTRKKQKLS